METILDRLELTEKEYGSRPAVDDGAVCLTYSELAAAARGIGAILSDRIGFYVSVNPEQPPERIRKILEVLESKIVVVDEARVEQLTASGYSGAVLHLEELYRDAPAASEGAEKKLQGIRAQLKGEDPDPPEIPRASLWHTSRSSTLSAISHRSSGSHVRTFLETRRPLTLTSR